MQCPTDCWECGTTADGTGICLLNGKCEAAKTKVGQKGGGCACALDPAAGDTPVGVALFGVARVFCAMRRRK
jgi:hypothetical protein